MGFSISVNHDGVEHLPGGFASIEQHAYSGVLEIGKSKTYPFDSLDQVIQPLSGTVGNSGQMIGGLLGAENKSPRDTVSRYPGRNSSIRELSGILSDLHIKF